MVKYQQLPEMMRMIATSIVHSGPGPRFLSEMLYDHLTGKSAVDAEARIEDITDDAMRASLLEVCWQINKAHKILSHNNFPNCL